MSQRGGKTRPGHRSRRPVRERWRHIREVGDTFTLGFQCGELYGANREREMWLTALAEDNADVLDRAVQLGAVLPTFDEAEERRWREHLDEQGGAS